MADELDAARRTTRDRGRRREATRVEVLATAIVVLAVILVVEACADPDRADPWHSRLVAVALLESGLFLVGWISLQLATGRLAQAAATRRREDAQPEIARLREDRSAQLLAGDEDAARLTAARIAHLQSLTKDSLRRWRVAGWGLTLAPVLVTVIALAACGIHPRGGDGDNPFRVEFAATGGAGRAHWAVIVVALAAVLSSLAAILVSLLFVRRYARRKPDEPPDRASVLAPDASQDKAMHTVVTMSGGGIRSAAFSLGGYNAVQAAPDVVANLDATVAVSGGSYVAAAIALTRTYDRSGNPRAVIPDAGDGGPDVLGAQDVYAVRSPELAYLRRNSRYLWQPWWRTWSGGLQLLGGAFLNLLLATAVLRAVAWGLGWFLPEVGVMSGLDTSNPHLNLWPHSWLHRVLTDGPWVVPALLVAGLLMVQTNRRRLRDLGSSRPGAISAIEGLPVADPPSTRGWARTVAFTTEVLAVALLAVILVPGLVTGLSHAAYRNHPTATLAKVIVNLGLTRPAACRSALAESAADAYDLARADQRLTSDVASADYGACGITGTVRLAAPSASGSTAPFDPGAAVSAAEFGHKSGVSGQVTGILAVLVAALGLIKRGFTLATRPSGPRVAALRRWLLLRVPLGALLLLGLWLLVLWTFQYSINAGSQTEIWAWAATLAGAVVGFVNPNLTSLNEFYRERLASAFAVGRGCGADSNQADGLPYDHRYVFSALPDRPELIVCATANVNDQRVVPARRGGVPLTFSPTQVRLEVGDPATESGYQWTSDIESRAGGPALTVMGAVAMSGAAVSPLMGRDDRKVAPFRLLLTLFNIRLGVWMRNPRWPLLEAESPWWAPMSTKPQFQQLLGEAFGSTVTDERWIYVTDGGHLDNLGLVEAARREPERVLVLSASNDPAGSWQDVGAAVSVLRADLGIDLAVTDRDTDGGQTWLRLSAEVAPERAMDVLVVRAAMPQGEDVLASVPVDVTSFTTRSTDFPRASTGRQDFGDLEFEAYRQLGQFLTTRAMRGAGWLPTPAPPTHAPAVDVRGPVTPAHEPVSGSTAGR